jgi:hypothetical protein
MERGETEMQWIRAFSLCQVDVFTSCLHLTQRKGRFHDSGVTPTPAAEFNGREQKATANARQKA